LTARYRKTQAESFASNGSSPLTVVAATIDAPVTATNAGAEGTNHAEEIRRIRAMPTEVGVLLIVAGIGGMLLPGPVGTPFLIAGCVMLWPGAFERIELSFEKRCPRMHHHSVRQMTRFLNDLERRYPPPK
jgi:hypothetical protein